MLERGISPKPTDTEQMVITKAKSGSRRFSTLVLLKDDNQSRNLWQIARVTETYATSEDGLVRKDKIALAVSDLDNAVKRKCDFTYLERPIQKLVLLQETEEIHDKEPWKSVMYLRYAIAMFSYFSLRTVFMMCFFYNSLNSDLVP